MRCEVCGNRILGKPRKVMIEGAKMVACEECAKLGSPYLEREVTPPKLSHMPLERATATTLISKRTRITDVQEGLELAENFGSLIRESREKMGLSHEDLGRKIGEKVSVLKKVESGKMFPDKRLATKLEHVLKVKLLVRAEERKVPETVLSSPRLTLGEVASLRTGKRRNLQNEGGNSP